MTLIPFVIGSSGGGGHVVVIRRGVLSMGRRLCTFVGVVVARRAATACRSMAIGSSNPAVPCSGGQVLQRRLVGSGVRVRRRLLLRAGGMSGASPDVVGRFAVRLGSRHAAVRGVAVAVAVVVVALRVLCRPPRRGGVVVDGAGHADPAVDREAHSWRRRRLDLDLSLPLGVLLLAACLLVVLCLACLLVCYSSREGDGRTGVGIRVACRPLALVLVCWFSVAWYDTGVAQWGQNIYGREAEPNLYVKQP